MAGALVAFVFYACTTLRDNRATCIAPVTVESEEACRQMERNFRATLDEMRDGTEARHRCAPANPVPAPNR